MTDYADSWEHYYADRVRGLERAIEDFLVKYDQCEPYIVSAFAMAQNRGQSYKGPNFAEELKALREAVK